MIVTLVILIGLAAAVYAAYRYGLLDPIIVKHDVAAITASLAKMRAKLLDAVEHHTDMADAHTQAASEATGQAVTAAKIADNLGALTA